MTSLHPAAARSELDRLAHWDGLIAELATAVIVTDMAGRIVIWNRAATLLYGWEAAEALGRPAITLLLDPQAEVELVAAMTAASAGLQWSGELESKRRDGSRVPVHLTLSAVYDDDRVVIGFVGESYDLSDLKAAERLLTNAERELRTADARQRAIVARSRDATLFFDPDGTIRWASPISYDLIGIGPDSLLGQNGLDFIHADDQERVFAEFVTMSSLGDHVRTEFRIIDPRGELRWVEEDATNLVDDPDVGYIVANIRDITDRRNAQEQLERLALHDQLTGLPNRSLLVNRLEQLLARERAAAVLYIDIDNFGDVNDSLGHAAGDELLRLVAERFTRAIAELPSTLARVGADEFVLLCDDISDATTTFSYAERLRESLKAPVQLAGQDIFVTVSIGIALSGDATDLMRDAGIAQQQAKQQGRDRVVIFDARLDSTQQNRLAVHNELRHALERDELVVWYQPIIELATGRVADVEALVRWRHPQRGLLGPQNFIDVAETSGLICALGSQVLREACTAARNWRELGCRFRISINAAAAQLSSPDFVAEIERALEEFGLDADQVTIELTETAAMKVADSLENLQRIRASASTSRSTTSAPAIRRSRSCASCPSTPSRSIVRSSPGSAPTRETRRSSRGSSRWQRRSATTSSPRASRPRRKPRCSASSAAATRKASCGHRPSRPTGSQRSRGASSGTIAWSSSARRRAPGTRARSGGARCPTSSGSSTKRRPRAPSVAASSGESSSRSTAASNSAYPRYGMPPPLRRTCPLVTAHARCTNAGLPSAHASASTSEKLSRYDGCTAIVAPATAAWRVASSTKPVTTTSGCAASSYMGSPTTTSATSRCGLRSR